MTINAVILHIKGEWHCWNIENKVSKIPSDVANRLCKIKSKILPYTIPALTTRSIFFVHFDFKVRQIRGIFCLLYLHPNKISIIPKSNRLLKCKDILYPVSDFLPKCNMLKSALDYFGGTNASNPVDHGSNINAIDDPLVGSVVDVGGVKVAVKRR